MSPDSNEYVLELMTQCELKLQTLHEKVQGKDLTALMKEMEAEEVSGSSINTHPALQWLKHRLGFWIDFAEVVVVKSVSPHLVTPTRFGIKPSSGSQRDLMEQEASFTVVFHQ